MKQPINNENIEIELFLEGIYKKYGYDFRGYAKSSIRRRILRRLALSGLDSISSMQHAILNDPIFFQTLLQDFSINVTEMFRDPSFYRVIRHKVIPVLQDLPFIKIWHAGCSTGEEVYSMAITLMEENIYDKTRIYATDSNIEVLSRAKKGIYSLDLMQKYTSSYQKAGGEVSFGDYYTAIYDKAIINNNIKRNIVFASHNLVTDSSFGEMDLIMCRNVMIYFEGKLQDKVLALFLESLNTGGFLCLGNKESVKFSDHSCAFADFDEKEKIYYKKNNTTAMQLQKEHHG